MRWILTLGFIISSFSSFAQGDKPRIEGQRAVSTDEDQSVSIAMTDVQVRDRDDWFYPFGFTMTLYPGDNYTVADRTVTPNPNFNGTLKVKVTVNDGENDSNPYNLEITVRPVNDVPTITNQNKLSTNENQPITLKTGDLIIVDPDDNAFTLSVSSGSNYSVSGTTITPAKDFSGTLTVPVQVSDGKATSKSYNLSIDVIAVNDIPQITGQVSLATDENKPITIELSHLTVVDTDNPYPTGFTLQLSAPANNTYTINGNEVRPALNFEGTLTVPVRVNDGKDFSAPFNLQITVRPGNNSPVITGQTAVTIKEDESFVILLSHLSVTDADNNYPSGFTLKIEAGENYTVTNNQITPAKDFFGKLIVSVVVNDGKSDSAPFGFVITISPVNDPPLVAGMEAEPLIYQIGSGAVPLSQALQITDAENDSIVHAEIVFHPQYYTPGLDELKFTPTNTIKGNFDVGRGILALTGKASLTDYTQLLKSVQYNFNGPPDIFIEGKKFSIKVSDKLSASAPATREIRTKAIDIDLDIPSAFTPNGDQSNDTWLIKPLKQSEDLNKALLRVYSRGGSLLYETVGFDKPWDGKLNGEVLPSDAYFYTIDLGRNYVKSSIKGVVTILR